MNVYFLKKRRLPWIGVGIGLALTLALPLAGPFGGLRWHDQQRIGQILIFTLVALGALALLRRDPAPLWPLERISRAGLLTVLGLGLWSAFRARYPIWALAEISLFVMCLALGWLIAQLRARICGPELDRWLMAGVLFLCAALSARFAVAYVSLITSGMEVLDPRVLLDGFSNVRFYGHIQVLTLPLIVWPLMATRMSRGKKAAIIGLGILWWIQAIFGGSRGIWLGMSVAGLGLVATGPAGRRWALWQAMLAAAGVACFWVLGILIPAWLNMTVRYPAADRLTLSLSGREGLWSRAIDLSMRHPFLGAGPMHFADVASRMPAHPHQAVLQWASEWGLPSTLIVLSLLAWAAMKTFGVLRSQLNDSDGMLRVCLAGAVLASGAQAMVDGVIVIPYSQLWLAIMSGWLLGIHPAALHAGCAMRGGRLPWGTVVALSTLILLAVVVRDAPSLTDRIERFTVDKHRPRLNPRFWIQGIIHETAPVPEQE